MANWTNEAKIILEQRYLKKDIAGKVVESPDEMLYRVASAISKNEKDKELWKIKFLEIMNSLEFLPNSPTLMNAGKEKAQLSACFVLPIADALSNIFEQVKQVALIHKTGGGCFANGTEVITKGGLKNIKDCFKNELVLCYNIINKRFEWGNITDVFEVNVEEKEKVEIEFEDGNIVQCTKDHPFLVKKDGIEQWIEAVKLDSTMEIVNFYRKENMRIKSIKTIKIKDQYFYDLNVYPNNNYVLGNGCVVHNTGLVFSKIRPANSLVGSTAGVASGPVSFMRVFDVATDVVKQGGVRRGANMGILHITHPDIYEFIRCKENLDRFQNFNISVSITDDFLKNAINSNKFFLKNFYTGERISIESKELLDLICYEMWKTGEPGVIFIDTINRKNPIPWLGKIEGCNPCGEQPLLPFESCNLGSIDVSKFIKDGKVDWDRLEEVVNISVRFLDNVIDVNHYPSVRIARKTKLTRKIGLGIMGWADMLIKLNIRYNSDKALRLAEKLMSNIQESAHMTSRKLGEEKGYCFQQLKRRNSTLTTIAPTGSLSILANCSSGIEPVFARDFTKVVLNNIKLNLGDKYKDIKDDVLVTAHQISPEIHIRMQASFQRHCDNAVSKTVNLPNSATVEEIKNIILLAHQLECKGITCYRDGTRKAPIEITTEGELSECDNAKCLI